MGVNSLPETAIRQRRDFDVNPGSSAPESSTLTTRLPSHPCVIIGVLKLSLTLTWRGSVTQASFRLRLLFCATARLFHACLLE